jgi:16S rRNA (guanine527-N7)-methyltransferase
LPPEFGPEGFARATDVSRETLARLKAFVDTLSDWGTRLNLVSQSSMADVWRRHVWDSAQLAQYVPEQAQSLADLGSGAGFPGLVLAILFRDRLNFRTTLFEATATTCRFLQAAARASGVKVDVRNVRVEELARQPFDVITARACAPLSMLLAYAARFQGPHTTNLFLKGQNAAAELTEAHKHWKMQVIRHPSQTDPTGTILEICELTRVR